MDIFKYDPDFEILINNTPDDDFSGLSPNQVHGLLYNPFSPDSSLQLQKGIDDTQVDKVPFFRLAEALLCIIRREEELKVTATGALPVKVVKELYEMGFIHEEIMASKKMKVYKEFDCMSILCARVVVQGAGMVKKASGKLSLTRACTKLLDANDRVQLFKKILMAYTTKMNWSIADYYSEYPVAQFGWAFSIYLLLTYGDQEQNSDFYGEKHLTAFPGFLDCFHETTYRTAKRVFLDCYSYRTLERFWQWFGFVSFTHQAKLFDNAPSTFRKSELLDQVFVFD